MDCYAGTDQECHIADAMLASFSKKSGGDSSYEALRKSLKLDRLSSVRTKRAARVSVDMLRLPSGIDDGGFRE